MKYDISKYYLGRLCKYNHKFNHTNKSLRRIKNKCCYECYKHYRSVILKNTNSSSYKSVECKYCHSVFKKHKDRIKQRPNNFCNPSCWAKYLNLNKVGQNTCSKLEKFLQSRLVTIYPNLCFVFNDRKTLSGLELDIYLPELKIAFEINGIVHYEPIYGTDELIKKQNSDKQKYIMCYNNDIELVIIDSSSQKYFKESNSIKFLDIIRNIIDANIGRLNSAQR